VDIARLRHKNLFEFTLVKILSEFGELKFTMPRTGFEPATFSLEG